MMMVFVLWSRRGQPDELIVPRSVPNVQLLGKLLSTLNLVSSIKSWSKVNFIVLLGGHFFGGI